MRESCSLLIETHLRRPNALWICPSCVTMDNGKKIGHELAEEENKSHWQISMVTKLLANMTLYHGLMPHRQGAYGNVQQANRWRQNKRLCFFSFLFFSPQVSLENHRSNNILLNQALVKEIWKDTNGMPKLIKSVICMLSGGVMARNSILLQLQAWW